MLLSCLAFLGFLPDVALFDYITFRMAAAFLSALIFGLWLGPFTIVRLRKLQGSGQPIRDDGPQQHLLTKQGTPTMGGVLILASLALSTLAWAKPGNAYVLWVLTITMGFGGLGAIDDILKVLKRDHHGVRPVRKMLALIALSVIAIASFWWITPSPLWGSIDLPFTKHLSLYVGPLFSLWIALVLVGSANAVNLTDGLDGLAIGPILTTTVIFSIITYIAGHATLSTYLHIVYVPSAGELCIACGALMGACLAFLWYNAPPASIFMGDTGSLALGGFLGALALVTRHELVFVIVGGIFVIEALSVILQVGYYKCTRKRIFLMAPIHHHFEKKGWAEATIVFRFWILSIIMGVLGLLTLKLR